MTPPPRLVPDRPSDCQHNNSSAGYDYARCSDCGAFRTDSGWGIASCQWFKDRAEAIFYKANGRLPERILPVAAPPAEAPAERGDIAGCDWPEGARFSVRDMPGEHDPCYLIMPAGGMLAFNHHAVNGVDQARAQFIASACNRALAAAPAAPVGEAWFADALASAGEVVPLAEASVLLGRARLALKESDTDLHYHDEQGVRRSLVERIDAYLAKEARNG